MPFIKFDFTTNKMARLLEKRLSEKIDAIEFPLNALGTLLGMRIYNSADNKNRPTNSLWTFHGLFHGLSKGFLFLVATLLLLSFPLNFYLNKTRSGLFWPILLVHLQGFICHLFGVKYFFLRMAQTKLKSDLLATSAGIGLIMQFRCIRTTNVFLQLVKTAFLLTKFSLLILFRRILLLFGITLIRGILLFIAVENILVKSPTLINPIFEVLRAFCSLCLFLAPAIAIPGFAFCASVLIFEHLWLAKEFCDDKNKCQISVIRHYVNAHRMLKNVLYNFHKYTASFWISLMISLFVATILVATHNSHNEFFMRVITPHLSFAEKWFCFFLALDSLILGIGLIVFACVFNTSQARLKCSISEIITQERALSMEAYAFITSYLSASDGHNKNLITFLWLRTIDGAFAMTFLIFTLLILYILMNKYC